MAVKIRLTRMGSKKKPYYRINVQIHVHHVMDVSSKQLELTIHLLKKTK